MYHKNIGNKHTEMYVANIFSETLHCCSKAKCSVSFIPYSSTLLIEGAQYYCAYF